MFSFRVRLSLLLIFSRIFGIVISTFFFFLNFKRYNKIAAIPHITRTEITTLRAIIKVLLPLLLLFFGLSSIIGCISSVISFL